jgi:hypothetical protein
MSMTEQPGAGQAGASQTPPAQQAGAENLAAASGDAQSKHAQPTIKIGDKTFAASDVEGIYNAKIGLDRENADLKKKLDEYESRGLTVQQKLEKEKADLAAENAALKKSVLNSRIQAALDAKGVHVKAGILNLEIADESQIEGAVQKLVSEYPGLVGSKPLPGNIPPGMPPPAGAPPASDSEAELMQKFRNARTSEELAKLNAEYHNLRGTHPREEGKII